MGRDIKRGATEAFFYSSQGKEGRGPPAMGEKGVLMGGEEKPFGGLVVGGVFYGGQRELLGFERNI